MADSPSELQFEIEKLERKHAEYPEGRFFVPLANAYRKMGDVETAEALLRAGVERHPDYLSAHIVLGRCLADRGATNEASAEFRFVLSQDPQNLIALRTLGELAAANGQPAEAADWYRELLAVDPMNEDARQALDSLGDAPASPELESEFRSGAGWWEPEPESPAPASDDTAVPGEVPPPEDDIGAAEIPLDIAPLETGEPDRWSGYSDVAALRSEVEPVPGETEETSYEADDRSSEVVTETIAELYARQGLVERAASVYRELIRRRGGDPALAARLAELEGEIAAEPIDAFATPEAAEPDAGEPAAGPDDTFAASFAEGFADEEPAFESVAGFETHADDAEEAEAEWEDTSLPTLADEPATQLAAASPTIVHFLAQMAAWRPGTGATGDVAAVQVEEVPPEAPEADFQEPEGEPDGEPDISSLPYLEEVIDSDASYGTGPAEEEEPFPWELPEAAPAVDQEPAAHDDQAESEPFFARDVTPEPESYAAAEQLPELAPEPDLPQPPGPATTGSAATEEDEDLESFQAWLRSLKR